MKKFNLTAQLLIVIALILVTTCSIFGMLVFNKIGDMSETTTLGNLTSITSATKDFWGDSSKLDEFALEENEDMQVAYIILVRSEGITGDISRMQNEDNGRVGPFEYQTHVSNNYLEILSNESEVQGVIQSVSVMPGTSGTAIKNIGSSGRIYIAYETNENGVSFVVFTNDKYANAMSRRWALDIAYIFIAVILLAAIIIYVWSKYYTTRLYRLTTHVKNLDKNNYEGSFTDDGKDELAVLTNTVEEMRKLLKNSEDVKKEMLQNVSHDFKTPISVIRGYAEAIRDGIEEPGKAELIINQAEILQAKVYKLLQYNRLEYLTKEEEFKEVSIKDIINNVILNYKNLDGIVVETNLDNTKFLGYEENFYTVIDNIMENAKRYAKSKIVITLKDGYLKFYNDGDHIDDKFTNNVFRAYEKGSKGQFGLGMSIVQRTLDFFGYEISVCNKDVGCEFTINRKPNPNVNQL